MPFLINLLISASLISLCVWLSHTNTKIAGFVLALPLTTLIALALTQINYSDSQKTIELAKSTAIAVMVTLPFFLPLVFAEKLKINFWQAYGAGFALLCLGFFIHQYIFKFIK